jgi:hypothetical protein
MLYFLFKISHLQAKNLVCLMSVCVKSFESTYFDELSNKKASFSMIVTTIEKLAISDY